MTWWEGISDKYDKDKLNEIKDRVSRNTTKAAEYSADYADAALSAVYGGAKGATMVAHELWVRDRPRRQAVRKKRRDKWWKKGGIWKALYVVEVVFIATWSGGKTSWKIARSTPRSVRNGAQTGWASTRQKQEKRRKEKVDQEPRWEWENNSNYNSDPDVGFDGGPNQRPNPKPDIPQEPEIEITVEDLPHSSNHKEDIVDAEVIMDDASTNTSTNVNSTEDRNEGNTMPGQNSGRTQDGRAGSNPVDVMSFGGELRGPNGLLAETVHMQMLTETAIDVQDTLNQWSDGLPDATQGAPWGTGAVSASAAEIAQAETTDDLREAITGMHEALDQADQLGEALDSVGAEGSVEAIGEE